MNDGTSITHRMNWSAAEPRVRTVEPTRVRADSGGPEHEVWDTCRKEQRSKAKGPAASDHTGQTVDSMWDYSAAPTHRNTPPIRNGQQVELQLENLVSLFSPFKRSSEWLKPKSVLTQKSNWIFRPYKGHFSSVGCLGTSYFTFQDLKRIKQFLVTD